MAGLKRVRGELYMDIGYEGLKRALCAWCLG